jgi:hypothetical protein
MKWKLERVISIATLVTSLGALLLVLKKPASIARPLPPAAVLANAQSFQAKIERLEQPTASGGTPPEVRLSAAEVTAALAQAAGAVAVLEAPQPSATALGVTPASPALDPGSPEAAIAPGEPQVKDYQVNFDGDVARGQFVAQIGGKDVYVTLSGHLGSKDGYATFDPTEFKVGDLDVPLALVNGALQKRLAEQKDRLKLPDGVGDIKVENGELVMTQK